jgi:hypothetical protein
VPQQGHPSKTATAPASIASSPIPTGIDAESTLAGPEPTAPKSASAVADALLARMRAEHAPRIAGGVGEGRVSLTAADLAAAATTAGIKPKSLRLALMTRTGCRITDDGGVLIEIAP